ncbi:MAG: cupin domain-containing protein [Planctomycetota bacterium]
MILIKAKKLSEAKRFITKDKSSIREIISPRNSVLKRQSLAESTVMPGKTTECHVHKKSEEIYFILRGKGEAIIGNTKINVTKGTAIPIPPMTTHCITNTGKKPFVFLCICSPSYSHDDTVICVEFPKQGRLIKTGI